jgi:iron complex transport system substrate-binding protein
MTITRKAPLRRAALGAALAAALLAGGCGSDSGSDPGGDPSESGSAGDTADDSTSDDSSGTRTFEADNGDVEIPTDPERVVALGSPGVFLSLGAQPVGMSDTTEENLAWRTDEQRAAYDAAVTDLGSAPDLDYEGIAALEPDLIVIHVPPYAWEGGNFDEDRLSSIAPTVFLAINNAEWETQGERVADAIGELDAFTAQADEYDALVAETQDEYGDVLDSTTFAVVNRWATTDEGSFAREYDGSYCTTHLVEAGFDIPGEPSADNTAQFEDYSMELLDDLAEFDAIIYPLGADGETNPLVQPVLDSNSWQALPAVAADHAYGVSCDVTLTYESRIHGLEAAQDVLEALAADQ